MTRNRKVERLIEVKKSDEEPSVSLRYYQQKLKPKETLQLVLNLNRPLESRGIQILPLMHWLTQDLWKGTS